MSEVIIVGCGYLGQKVALKHLDQGDRVEGVVKSDASRRRLVDMGVDAVSVDLDQPLERELPLFTGKRLYYFAPPLAVGEKDPRVERLIGAFEFHGHPIRVVYISTTGVYGNCAGAWINENRPIAPKASRAKRRAAAESAWRNWCEKEGAELVVLRVAGIYGPDRLPLKRLKEGLPLLREQEAPFTNRIHVDDLVNVCIAAMERGQPGGIYNVSDGHPSTMVDYFCQIADMAGLPHPPLVNREEAERMLSKGMLSYMDESRRLNNTKMLRELQLTLDYPTLAEGLKSCF